MKHLFLVLLCLSGVFSGCTATSPQKNDRSFFHLNGEVSSMKVTRTVPADAKYEYEDEEGFEEERSYGSILIFSEMYRRDESRYEFQQDGSFKSVNDYVFTRKGDETIATPKTKPTTPNNYYNILIYKTNAGENEFTHDGRFEEGDYKGISGGGGNISTILSFDQFGRLIENKNNEPFDQLRIGECYGNDSKCTYIYQGSNHLPTSVSIEYGYGGTGSNDEFDITYGKLDDQKNWLSRTLLFKGTDKVAFTEQRTITYY